MYLPLNEQHPYPQCKKEIDLVKSVIVGALAPIDVPIDGIPKLWAEDMKYDGDGVRATIRSEDEIRHPLNLQHVVHSKDRKTCIGVHAGGSFHFNHLEAKWIMIRLDEPAKK